MTEEADFLLAIKIGVRHCSACATDKCLTEFHAYTSRGRRGHQAKCKKCQSESFKRYSELNPTRIKRLKAAWIAKNPGYAAQHRAKQKAEKPDHVKRLNRAKYLRNQRKNIERVLQWRAENREIYKAYFASYRNSNKAKVAEWDKKKRAKRSGAASDGTVTPESWADLKKKSGGRCYWCLLKTDRLQQDHYVPLSRGGAHVLSNIVPACAPCNNKKNSKDPLVFAASLGRLV